MWQPTTTPLSAATSSFMKVRPALPLQQASMERAASEDALFRHAAPRGRRICNRVVTAHLIVLRMGRKLLV